MMLLLMMLLDVIIDDVISYYAPNDCMRVYIVDKNKNKREYEPELKT